MHVRASSRDISVPPNCLSGEVDAACARARETAAYARGTSAHVSVHASPPRSGRVRRGKEAAGKIAERWKKRGESGGKGRDD